MRKITLINLLKKEGKTKDTVIDWAYYGYGFLHCVGKNKISELPPQVKYAKCFEITDSGMYKVDGAL